MTKLSATFARYADRKVPRYTSYPTAPHFHDGIGAGQCRDWIGSLAQGSSLSLYLHVPFCVTMCSYCGCHTKITKRYQPVADYAQHLKQELENVARHMNGRMSVRHIAWGGGTPTMLSHEHFVMLMQTIGDLFDLDERAEIAVEGDPRTLDNECVRMLVDGGVNRVSFGVQDFNLHVQEAIGRVQSFEMTRDVTHRLWDAGIKDINFDLMYGLPKQSTQDVMRSMELATRIGPQRIALFGYAHVPWFKSHQRLIKESDLPDQHARFEQTEAAAGELVRLGYVRIGLDHFARPEDDMAIALADGTLRRNFQGYTTDPADAMLPFGASSIGQLPQGYVQNITDIGNWKRKVEAGGLSTARGLEFSADDKLRGEVIEKIMCNLSVDLEAVCAAHGVSAGVFSDELAQIDLLARDGLVVRDGLRLFVPEEHRAFIRIVSAVFDAYLKTAQAKHSVAV